MKLLILLFFIIPNFAFGSDITKNFFNNKNRQHIHIVGSSTVYPFVASIAETFGRESNYKTPIVESTGTGGGFKLFCSGIGFDYPDFVNASRKIKNAEQEKCYQNNINFGEIKIGFDAIILANSVKGIKFNLTKEQIFLALGAKVPDLQGNLIDNPYKKWNEINKNLPDIKIAIYGPPATSGTRDSFVELIMHSVCASNKIFIKNYPNTEILHKKCQLIRQDGHYIEAGENDNLIVQKLKNEPNALGIFGYSFLQENKYSIQSSSIDNIEPTTANIIDAKYKISRPLFIYFKKPHLTKINGMQEFIKHIINNNTLGKEGYLVQNGLIPLSNQEIEKMEDELLKNL